MEYGHRMDMRKGARQRECDRQGVRQKKLREQTREENGQQRGWSVVCDVAQYWTIQEEVWGVR